MIRRRIILLVVVLQIFFLLFMTSLQYVIEWVGEEVVLESSPIDPYDLLYGNYIQLRYEIHEVSMNKWQGVEEPTFDDNIYVVLSKVGDYHQIAGASPNRPKAAEGQVVLKAKVNTNIQTERWVWDDPEHDEEQKRNPGRMERVEMDPFFSVSYGLERYYVSSAEAKEIEERRGEKLDIVLKVAPWGQVKLSELKYK